MCEVEVIDMKGLSDHHTVVVRLDRDTLVGAWNAAPRLGVAWALPGRSKTTVRAGYAVVYEETNMRLLTRPLDQYALTTYYAPDGRVTREGAAMVFTAGSGRLSVPRAHNWSTAQNPIGTLAA